MFYVILMYMICNILASVIQFNHLHIFIKLLMVFADLSADLRNSYVIRNYKLHNVLRNTNVGRCRRRRHDCRPLEPAAGAPAGGLDPRGGHCGVPGGGHGAGGHGAQRSRRISPRESQFRPAD